MRRRAVLSGLGACVFMAGTPVLAATPRRRRRPAPPKEDAPAEEPPPEEQSAPAATSRKAEITGPSFDPAPMPNQDAHGPAGPADTASSLAPTVFRNQQQFRGNAFAPGDSVQNSEDHANKPAVGFSLHVPQ